MVHVTEREGAGVLQKELPPLRKEEGKPGEVDLLLVGFHLAEVGPVREVQCEVRSNAVLQIDAGIDLTAAEFVG